jgi:hypothetical protein
MLNLSVNGYRARLATVADLRHELLSFANEAFREVWINAEGGPALCALFNGGNGFLMYLRKDGDVGFTSRNPNYRGEANAVVEYRLSNGQHDVYPASWALTEPLVIKALEHFIEHQERAPFIKWHDDSV